MSLKAKFLSGSLWMMLGTVFNNVIAFVIFAVLARLLSPAEIGAVLFAVIFIDVGRHIASAGIPEALIKRAEWTDEAGSTGFWLNMAFASVITLTVIFGVVPLVRPHFDESAATALLALSSMFLIDSARAVHVAYLRRTFRYDQLALRGLKANTTAGVVAVWLAFEGWGIWALVFQRIVQAVIVTGVTWHAARWMPKFRFSWAVVREIRGFAVQLMGARMLEITNNKMPEIMISGVLGAAQLAFFRIGQRSLDLATQVLVQPIQDVALSSFSRKNAENPAVRNESSQGYLTVLAVTSALVFPSFLGAGALAPDLITLFFGDKWDVSALVMSILAFQVVPMVTLRISTPALMAASASRSLLALQLLNLSVGATALFVGTQEGLLWGAGALVLSGYLLLPYVIFSVTRVLGVSARAVLGKLVPPALASVVMFAVLYALQYYWLFDFHQAVRVPVVIVTGALVYVVCMVCVARGFTRFLHQELKPIVPARIKPTYMRVMNKLFP